MIVLVIGSASAGGGTKDNDTKQMQEAASMSYTAKKDVNEDLLPKTNHRVKYSHYYQCFFGLMGTSENYTKSEYREDLLAKGFELTRKDIISEITYEYYVNDSKRILLIDLEDSLLITITDRDGEIEKEEGIISNNHVLELIQQEYQIELKNGDSSVSKDFPPEIIIKCQIPQLYQKTKMLAYCALTKEGREAGRYLIADDKVMYTSDPLEMVEIADVDHDGIYELLSLYGYGFGIYRFQLNVYQYSNPIYFNSYTKVIHRSAYNTFVPVNGDGQLAFFKINDSEVHLMEAKDTADSGFVYETDYGRLTVLGTKIYAKPDKAIEFPYYEWDQNFKQEDKKMPEYDQKYDQQVPELTITIGDTTLKNVSWKEIWGEVCDVTVSFSDLMKKSEEISNFRCPKEGMYGFEDEICFHFKKGEKPKEIQVQDYLISKTGEQKYGAMGMIKRELRYGKDGNYYLGLTQHMANYFSSDSTSYTEKSYRGFRIRCEFDNNHICEYVFVLSLDPVWDDMSEVSQ